MVFIFIFLVVKRIVEPRLCTIYSNTSHLYHLEEFSQRRIKYTMKVEHRILSYIGAMTYSAISFFENMAYVRLLISLEQPLNAFE